MDAIRSFFTGPYAVDVCLDLSTRLRDDLWLDHLGLEDLVVHLNSCANVTIRTDQLDTIFTIGDLLALCASPSSKLAETPVIDEAVIKTTFAMALDRFKSERQRSLNAIPMVCFYHAGSMAASMRSFSAALDKVTGATAVNPCWVELPGRGVRVNEPLCNSVFETAPAIARAVVVGLLKNDLFRPFFIFGHSYGTLHAFEGDRKEDVVFPSFLNRYQWRVSYKSLVSFQEP